MAAAVERPTPGRASLGLLRRGLEVGVTVPLLVGHLRVSRSGRLGSPLLGAIGAEDAGASRGLRWRENAGVLARVAVGGVADGVKDGGAFGEYGCHQQVFGAGDGGNVHDEAGAAQFAARFDVAFVDVNVCAECLHAFDVLVHRARAAAENIVPASSGAAKAIGLVIPELAGRLDGAAQRVPVAAGSLTELISVLEKPADRDAINAAMKAAADESFGYTEDEIVSSDVIGMEYGSLFDATQTRVMSAGGQYLAKTVAWYDNEMSYTAQLVRTLGCVARGL